MNTRPIRGRRRAAKEHGPTTSEAIDILWGAGAIGRAIGRSPRSTFHLLENGHLPAKKVGRLWSASRRRLLAHLAGEETPGSAA